jgi:hypothetical protein
MVMQSDLVNRLRCVHRFTLDGLSNEAANEIEKLSSLLFNLSNALDNAFISSWQTTDKWQKYLDEALDYFK